MPLPGVLPASGVVTAEGEAVARAASRVDVAVGEVVILGIGVAAEVTLGVGEATVGVGTTGPRSQAAMTGITSKSRKMSFEIFIIRVTTRYHYEVRIGHMRSNRGYRLSL